MIQLPLLLFRSRKSKQTNNCHMRDTWSVRDEKIIPFFPVFPFSQYPKLTAVYPSSFLQTKIPPVLFPWISSPDQTSLSWAPIQFHINSNPFSGFCFLTFFRVLFPGISLTYIPASALSLANLSKLFFQFFPSTVLGDHIL